jgi:hypothetical protein
MKINAIKVNPRVIGNNKEKISDNFKRNSKIVWYTKASFNQGNKMFKPEYIQENYLLFGYAGTLEIVYNRFRKLGKSCTMARIMAHQLMMVTIK